MIFTERFYISGTPNNARRAPPLQPQDKVGYCIYTIDYTATIKIEGGATLTFHGDDQNGYMITNFAKLVVPEIAPAPKPCNDPHFIRVV